MKIGDYMLINIGERIWSVPVEFKVFALIQLNGRATIIQLNDGSLWVHPPVKLSADLKAEVDALGEVKHLVAPSLLHHLYLSEWHTAYSQAQVYAPKGLEKKQPRLKIDHYLSRDQSIEHFTWSDEIKHIPLRGMSQVREHIFFHQSSQICLLTDLCFFFEEAKGFTKFYLSFNKVYKRLGIPKIFKMMIKDKTAFNESLRQAAEWDIQGLSLCHHALPHEIKLSEWTDIVERGV